MRLSEQGLQPAASNNQLTAIAHNQMLALEARRDTRLHATARAHQFNRSSWLAGTVSRIPRFIAKAAILA
jgi:hypothetical protein